MRRLLLIVAALALLLYTGATMFTQVQPGERAVIRRFGRILDYKPDQGLYIGLPWGMERVDLVPVSRARSIKVGFGENPDGTEEVVPPGQMLTGDHNLVNVQAVIEFKVREADVHKFVLHKDTVDALTARTAEALMAEWVAGHKVDEVLLRGKIDLPVFLRERLQIRMDAYDLGIEIERANVTELFPPKQVKEAFDRLAQAQTNIRTQVNKAEQDADRRRSDTQAAIFSLERQARAYETEELIKAKAEADGFEKRLSSYRTLARDNPDYLNALWVDEMTRMYARMRETGRIDVLDHYLTEGGLSVTQFPLQKKR